MVLFATRFALALLLGLTIPVPSPGYAQSVPANVPPLAGPPLPDAPTPTARRAPWYAMTIAPDQAAPRLTLFDKALGGLRDSVYPPSPVAWIASASWSHLINSSPNYGTDKGAFGQRLGASAVRDISETVFNKSVFAPIFHEDPRYYQLGRGHGIIQRGVYAATRVFVTRSDDGRPTPNYSLLLGHASGAALTATYYPARNTGFGGVSRTFATSLGGSALGFVVDEFLDDGLRAVHLKKAE